MITKYPLPISFARCFGQPLKGSLGSWISWAIQVPQATLDDGKIRSQAENLPTLLGNLYLCLMSDDVYQYNPEGIFRLLDDDIHFPLRLEAVISYKLPISRIFSVQTMTESVKTNHSCWNYCFFFKLIFSFTKGYIFVAFHFCAATD